MKSQDELKRLYDYNPDTGELISKLTKKPIGTPDSKRQGLKSGFGRVHRLIWVWMTGDDISDDVIDHINGDPMDNRWSNLRRCSRHQNSMNRTINTNNSSGMKGVTFVFTSMKWRAHIGYMGSVHYLGEYDTADEAYDVYLEEAEKLFGEYMRDG